MDQWLFSIHCHHQYNSRNVYSILKKVSSIKGRLTLFEGNLNSCCCTKLGRLSLFFSQVSSELQSHADRSPGLVVNIVEARRRLAGMETSDLLR